MQRSRPWSRPFRSSTHSSRSFPIDWSIGATSAEFWSTSACGWQSWTGDRQLKPICAAASSLRAKLAAELTNEPLDAQDLLFTLSRLGSLLHRWGRPDDAADCYRRLVSIKPASTILHNQLAWFLLTCPDTTFRDPHHAQVLAAKAVEQAPGNADYWNTLALAQVESNAPQPAIASAERAISLRKEVTPFDNLVLARAHHRLGNSVEAQRYYERAQLGMAGASANDEILQRIAREVGAELKDR